MAEVFDDTTDFSEYLQETEAKQRVIKASAYTDDVVAHFHGEKKEVGATLPWPKTHEQIRLRRGEVSLWTGINGHGKSLLLGQVCLGLAAQGEKGCIASMEMRPEVTIARSCRQASAVACPSIDYIRRFHKATENLLWLYDHQGTVQRGMLLAVVRYCAYKLKLNYFVIDSLMKCGIFEDDFNGQAQFIDQLTSIARDSCMHIHLVAHSRKGKDEYTPPGKMDVKGTGSITDQVDNVFAVWRNKRKEQDRAENNHKSSTEPDALVICDKQRNGDWEGKVALWYLAECLQYVEFGTSGVMSLMPGI